MSTESEVPVVQNQEQGQSQGQKPEPKKGVSVAPLVLLAVVILALALIFVIPYIGAKSDGEDGTPAMIVNGQVITQEEINGIAEFFRMQQAFMTPEMLFGGGEDGLRRGAARQLAANVLMLEDVKSRGWVLDPAVVDARINALAARFGGREAFSAQLAMMGESEEEMRASVAEDILLDSLLTVVSAVDSISESERRTHYEEHKTRYTVQGRARASHIIFMFDPAAMDTAAEAEAAAQAMAMMERAGEALTKARGGVDFDRLITEYSSMPNSGDMGWFRRGDLSPELDNALFALKNGEISGLVPSNMGIHIIKKTDEEAPRQMTFEEADERITGTMRMARSARAANSYIDGLLAAANILYMDSSLVVTATSGENPSAP
ncbi:MAG: peptidylprolyl isomerase [Chitinispirillales bacterium]|nr:peptidylprolyl isomerase [Chitinispirillales bacterium]